jgi:glycosyltransferase involved in cell wall biosynthesis
VLHDALAAVNPALELEILRRVRALEPELAIVVIASRPLVSAEADRRVVTGVSASTEVDAATALLEAMASARPVVATDVAGIRESLGDGCGAVVPPGDEAALAAALAARLSDPGRALQEGQAARVHAERSLDVRRTHAYLMNLIDGLIAQS